jgi:hypothetical protein
MGREASSGLGTKGKICTTSFTYQAQSWKKSRRVVQLGEARRAGRRLL